MRWLYFLGCCLCAGIIRGQFITVEEGKYGLIDLNGNPILANEWDKVEQISDDGSIYRYDRNDSSGVYVHSNRLLLPCRYSVEALSDNAFSLCSEGNCGLIARSSEKGSALKYQWTGALWTNLYEINSRFAGAFDGELFGVLSIVDSIGDSIVPFLSETVIYRSNQLGFHSYDTNGNVILYAPGSSEKFDVVIPTRSQAPKIHGNLVYFSTSAEDSLIIKDYHDGSILCSFALQPGKGIEIRYDEEWHCIYRITPQGKKKRLLELINPYNGEVLIANVGKRNTHFRFESDPLERDIDRPVKLMLYRLNRRATIYTHLGEIHGYVYTPAETVTRIWQWHKGYK